MMRPEEEEGAWFALDAVFRLAKDAKEYTKTFDLISGVELAGMAKYYAEQLERMGFTWHPNDIATVHFNREDNQSHRN